MSLLADDSSFVSKKQFKPICSKMVILSVVVLSKKTSIKVNRNYDYILLMLADVP
jgi:hypothetical protein